MTSSASFANSAGTAGDPDTVNFIVQEPDGTKTTYVYGVDAEVVRGGTGAYSSTVVLANAATVPVEYRLRWEGVGTINSADETSVTVWPSRIS